MNICKMCVNHRQDDQSDPDDVLCEEVCFEYIEFTALPVYEAAPDMYEALRALILPDDIGNDRWCPTCKRIVSSIEVTNSEHHENCGTYLTDVNSDEWQEKARQALAKAEGRKEEN